MTLYSYKQLESTMKIPSISKGPGIHFVWPGLEPRNGNFVFQNVIGDDQPTGRWTLATWYGPYDAKGDYYEYGTIPGETFEQLFLMQMTECYIVTHGDTLTTIFDLNLGNGEWNDPWYLTPGSNGVAAGETSGSGGVNIAFPNEGALTDVCPRSRSPFLILAH
jgi:hypothetical protein